MKNNIAIWVLIVIIFIGGLIYFTHKGGNVVDTSQTTTTTDNNTMQNTQTVTGTNGAVKYIVTKEGTGAVAKIGDAVSMNYTGTLADGTVFDSNVDPKFQHVTPFIFTIGQQQVIKGWDVGIAGMKVGEKRTLIIDPTYAYGAAGAGGVIPPNATLTFDVELVAIK